jgi:hypothetical protein
MCRVEYRVFALIMRRETITEAVPTWALSRYMRRLPPGVYAAMV